MDKKLFAAAAVGILILAGAGFIIERARSQTANPAAPHSKKYPIPPPNVVVANGPKGEAETTLAISLVDHDTMVAGAKDFNTPSGDNWCGFYTSHDRGKTWKAGMIGGWPGGPSNVLTGYKIATDPVVASDSKGDFYFAGLAFVPPATVRAGYGCVFVAKSTNNGDSFDQVVIVDWSLSWRIRFQDKEWMVVDPKNNNIYLSWDSLTTETWNARVMFSRSTDGGKSWSVPYPVSGYGPVGFIESSVMAVDLKSTIHIAWTYYTSKQHTHAIIRYAHSTDSGRSFTGTTDVTSMNMIPNPLPNCKYRTFGFTSLAVDTSNGNDSGSIYIVWPDYGTGDSDILLMHSSDGGTTWDGPVRVNNDTECNGADQFMPWVAVSAEGWVHVGFYDRRCDQNNTLLEYWWAISFDGGQTFPINIPMSNTSFDGDMSNGVDEGQVFIGDYNMMVANNETVAAVWCDMRNASDTTPQADVYGAVVPYKELLKTNKFANVTIPWPGEKGG